MRAIRWLWVLGCGAAACGPGGATDTTDTGDTAGTTDGVVTVASSSGSGSPTGDATGLSSTGTSSETGGSTGFDLYEMDIEYCPLDWPAAGTITGTTPFGPFTGPYARFGWIGCYGGASEPELVILADEPALVDTLAQDHSYYDDGARPFPALRIRLDSSGTPTDWHDAGWTGDSMEYAEYYGTMGIEAEATALADITITMSVPVADTDEPVMGFPRIVGTLSIQGDGWDLAGSFDAAYCGPLAWGHECA